MKIKSLIFIVCLIINILLSSIPVFATEIEYKEALSDEMLHSYLTESLDEETIYSSSISTYNNFLTSYYDNLTYNYGVNYKNSCGYIALGMLLSYYDTYLNDDIIPEQYDISSIGLGENMIARRNSPGILRDIIENVNNPSDKTLSGFSANDYYYSIEGMSNQSLHAKLISIGASLNMYNFSSNNAPALTNVYERRNILNSFLTTVSEISSENYDVMVYSGTSDDVRTFTINAIQSGYPVLLSVAVPNVSIGHAVVAYDYDAVTETIFCHWGLGANKTHISPESQGFSIFRNAMVIDFNIEHSHTENYGVTTITNNIPSTEYYCYDNCDIVTYIEKEHNHNVDYESCSNYYHNSYCECGDYIVENHTLIDNVCSLCNHVHTHEFAYLPYQSLSHKSLCDICGYYKIEPHITTIGVGHGKTCIRCGAIIGSGGLLLDSIVPTTYITDNGSFVRSDGIIVLSEIDYLLYINGELDIDSLISQGGMTH